MLSPVQFCLIMHIFYILTLYGGVVNHIFAQSPPAHEIHLPPQGAKRPKGFLREEAVTAGD
jgi:hypothetical protein